MKKIVLVCIILLAVGCNNKKMEEEYNNIKEAKDNIDSYKLDLRVYGISNNKKVNEIVKVINYAFDYEINITASNNVTDGFGIPITSPFSITNDDIIYINNGKVYVKDDSNKYSISKDKLKYTDPSVYLNGLDNIKKIKDIKEERIGNKIYKQYDVLINSNVSNDIVKDIGQNELISEEEMSASVYLDDKNALYQIIYYIDSITINANYYSINQVDSITFPFELN